MNIKSPKHFGEGSHLNFLKSEGWMFSQRLAAFLKAKKYDLRSVNMLTSLDLDTVLQQTFDATVTSLYFSTVLRAGVTTPPLPGVSPQF